MFIGRNRFINIQIFVMFVFYLIIFSKSCLILQDFIFNHKISKIEIFFTKYIPRIIEIFRNKYFIIINLSHITNPFQ